jgi:protein ImuA
MSHGGVSERIGFLRRRIAAIEARDSGARRRVDRAAGDGRSGGEAWAPPDDDRGALGEIMPVIARDAPAAAAFALALTLRRRAIRRGGALVWIVEDMNAREFGLPYARGLVAAGVDLARFALIRTQRPRETLWAMEEALKSPACPMVVAESHLSPALYSLSASRRLRLAAHRGGGLGLLLAQNRATGGASAADWRIEIAAPADPAPRRTPLPALAPDAFFRWRLRILKARLDGPGTAADPAQWRDLVFNLEEMAFRDAFPESVSATSGRRPVTAMR